MAFVVYHDDPKLLASIAGGVGAYRAAEDQDQRNFRDMSYADAQRRDARNFAYGAQQDAARQGQRIHDQLIDQENQQRRFEQQNQLARMQLDTTLSRQQQQDAERAALQEDRQKFSAEQADRQRGFKVMQDVGGVAKDWIEGVGNWFTGNTPRQRQDAREQSITEREAARRAEAQDRANRQEMEARQRAEQSVSREERIQRRADQDRRLRAAAAIMREQPGLTIEDAMRVADSVLGLTGSPTTQPVQPLTPEVQPSPVFNIPSAATQPTESPATQQAATVASTQPARPGPGQAKMRLADGRIVIVDKRTHQIVQEVSR